MVVDSFDFGPLVAGPLDLVGFPDWVVSVQPLVGPPARVAADMPHAVATATLGRRFRLMSADNFLESQRSLAGMQSAWQRGMSFPRQILAGNTVMITRRTVLRTFLLRPDPRVQQIYLYCLAVLAARYDIAVHVPMLMSTHEHLMVTDQSGQLPSFVRDLHRTVAQCIKALHDWNGSVWDQRRSSIVQLATPEAIIETAAYMIANPVVAGLVPTAAEWPGVTIAPSEFGRARWTVARPNVYFSRTNALWPDTATLELAMPDLRDNTPDAVRTAISAQVGEAEAIAAADLRARGLKFLGIEAVTQCSPFERAKSLEPAKGHNPTFAVGKGQKDAYQNASRRVRIFRQTYREALNSWRNGARDVAFPSGTWLMLRLHRARVEEVPETLARAS